MAILAAGTVFWDCSAGEDPRGDASPGLVHAFLALLRGNHST
jgi:hypothetical protein